MKWKQTQIYMHICTHRHIDTQNTNRDKLMPSGSKCPRKTLNNKGVQRRE